MEEEHRVIGGPGKNATHGQLQITRPHGANQGHTVPQAPAAPLHRGSPDDARRPLANELPLLFRSDPRLGQYLEQRVRVAGELGKEVPFVLIDAAEPEQARAALHLGQTLDALLVIGGQHVGQRNFVPHRHPRGGVRRRDGVAQPAQEHLEHRQQQQAHRHAAERQRQPPFIADRVAENEPGQGHWADASLF